MMTDKTSKLQPPRRWFRFSLRFLLLLILFASIPVWWLTSLRRQAIAEQTIVESLQKRHPEMVFVFDYAIDDQGYLKKSPTPPAPKWLRELFHEQLFAQVHEIMFGDTENADDLKLANDLRGLKKISFANYQGKDLDCLSGLVSLEDVVIGAGSEIKNINGIEPLVNLKRIEFRICNHISDYSVLQQLPMLQEVQIWGGPIKNFESLAGADSIESLYLFLCRDLTTMNGIHALRSLNYLEIQGSDNLRDYSSLSNNQSIETLVIRDCFILRNIDPLWSMTQLKRLSLSRCRRLNAFDGLVNLVNLTELNLAGCREFTQHDLLSRLAGLEKLELGSNDHLTNLESLTDLKNLKSLDVSGCKNLEDLTAISQLPKLRTVKVQNCPHVDAQKFTELSKQFPNIQFLMK